jgi:hypothetical protein
MRRWMIVSIVAGMWLVSMAGPSSAAAPTSTRHTSGIDEGNYISCPGFDVGFTAAYNATSTTFYDGSGAVVRSTEQFRFTGTLFNESHPSRSLPYEGDAYIAWTPERQSAMGNYMTRINGRAVQLETGIAHVDFSTGDVTLHGLWQDELLCDPLSRG